MQSGEVQLRSLVYETTVSTEHFLAAEIGHTLLGFCRLSLPSVEPITPELNGAAMIREVHVYGLSRQLGQGSVAAMPSTVAWGLDWSNGPLI